nr:MAG TPA: hypothetical protein [Caudoviricetes sp.]
MLGSRMGVDAVNLVAGSLEFLCPLGCPLLF